MYGPKVFLLTKIKPEYSDSLVQSDTLPWSLGVSGMVNTRINRNQIETAIFIVKASKSILNNQMKMLQLKENS